jgi:uncharacterized protein (DUF885 family)
MPYAGNSVNYSRRPKTSVIPALAFSVASLAFACAGAKPPFQFKGPPPANASDRAMARFADRYLDSALRIDPVRASALGYKKYDRFLPDWSAAGVERSAATLQTLERELIRIDVNKLSTAYSIDHELIAAEIARSLYLSTALRTQDWDVQQWAEAIGAAFYHVTLPPDDAAEWPEKLDATLARLTALPLFLEQAKATLKNPPRVFTEFVLTQAPGQLDTIENQLPKLFAGDAARKARFEQTQPKAAKALREFFAWMESDLLPRSTGDYRLGKERFEKKLEHTLGSTMKAAEVYAAAEHALQTARFEMYDLALPLHREMLPGDQTYLALTGDERINAVVGRVIGALSSEHGTAESLFDDVRAVSNRLKTFIGATQLIALPPAEDNFVIERTPPFLDGLAVAFYNPAPAFQPDVKKSFWISTVPGKTAEDKESFLREYNRHTLLALVIHEAFPGHYVQGYWSSHSPNASIVKSALESGTMTEGWAVLIEELMHRRGVSKDNVKERLFHLKMRLRVFANAMIDTRLHTSREEESALDAWALELMKKKAFQEDAEATRKLRRAKLSSTQLSTYFVGYKEMLGVYDDARRIKKVDEKKVLEEMISYGAIPPRLIRRAMHLQ